VLERLLIEVPEPGRKGIERALGVSQDRGRPVTAPALPEHRAHPDHPAKPANSSAAGWPAATAGPVTTDALAPGNEQAAPVDSAAPSSATNADRPASGGSAPPSDTDGD
jgi:hypothetical protein